MGLTPDEQFGKIVSLSRDGAVLAARSGDIGLVRIYRIVNERWSQIGQTIEGIPKNLVGRGLPVDRTGTGLWLTDNGRAVGVGGHKYDVNGTLVGGWTGSCV